MGTTKLQVTNKVCVKNSASKNVLFLGLHLRPIENTNSSWQWPFMSCLQTGV